MQRLEVSGAVRPVYGSLGVKRLTRLATVILPQRKVPHKTRRSKTRYQDTRYTQCTVRSVQCAVCSVQVLLTQTIKLCTVIAVLCYKCAQQQ